MCVSTQYFTSDRKVDEAVGNLNRFYGDPDDLLPSVMKFGKSKFMMIINSIVMRFFLLVVSVQETYSSWNENPQAAIEKSSIKVCLPPLVMPKQFYNENNSIAGIPFIQHYCLPPPLPPLPFPHFLRPEFGLPFTMPRPIINTNGLFCGGFPNQNVPPPIQLPRLQHIPLAITSAPSQTGCSYPYKYSPEFLAVFQERVRNSLYRQGVVR